MHRIAPWRESKGIVVVSREDRIGGQRASFGGIDHDSLLGGTGNDSMDGGAGNDVMSGGDGGDTMVGGLGADTLFGDNSNERMATAVDFTTASDGSTDSLVGGSGTDTLFGDAGGDLDVLFQ